MFTPSELERMPVEIERIFSELEIRILEDVIRRIGLNEEVTRSADWQIYRLVQMGKSSEKIQKYIKKALDLTDREIRNLYEGAMNQGYTRNKAIYEEVGADFVEFKDNMELQQLIQATIDQTRGQMENITQTLGFAIQMNGKTVYTPFAQYLQRTLDRAVMEVSTGAFDYNSTLKRVVGEMTRSGIRTVDYDSGRTYRVEVAARMALMTGINQVTNRITENNAKELGTEHFEVSWHATARPSHQLWQGRVYNKQELHDVCGLGEVTGLLGANCYHSYYPFVKGISKRQWTDEELDKMNAEENKLKIYYGKKYTTYEATQYQRRLESTMRKQRQDIKLLRQGKADEEDLVKALAKYQGTMAKYRDFSKAMKLPEQKQRVYMDGLGRVG